ncbi:hypothetical protein GOODEAATRI_011467, partial [Goodea atripinnis]
HLLVIKEELPAEEQNWSPRPDQEDQNPPQIKEEPEEAEIIERREGVTRHMKRHSGEEDIKLEGTVSQTVPEEV